MTDFPAFPSYAHYEGDAQCPCDECRFAREEPVSDEHLELTHIWKDQSGNVVAKLYGGVSLIPEIAKRQARIEELEASETRLIEERDSYHEWADRLANAIAAHVGEEIGEHTSANSPWANALELIEAETEELPANSDL